MEKVFVKDVHDKDQVKSIFLVARKTATAAKSGKPFLAITLRDKTGELDARVWERIEDLDPKFAKGDLVQVEGLATMFQGRPQLRIDAIEKVGPDGIDMSEFAAPPKASPGERSFTQISEMVDRLQDPHLKALLRSFLDDENFAADFKRAPAAKSVHHSHAGGLADHTLSVMRLSQRIAEHYPMVDRELMLAGAFLHDIGKLREMSLERQTEYTDEGRLIGHLIIAAEMLHDHCARLQGFPRVLETHLTHIVLAHHGSLEFGSPRLPQTLEAMLVHYIDELDSRMGSWLEIMQRDQGETWTDFQKLYGRHLYKGPSPTTHGRAPVERRRKKARGEKPEKAETAEKAERPAGVEKAKEKHAEATTAAGEPSGRPEGQPGREKRERAPKEKLTFKPFAALASAAESAQEEAGAVENAAEPPPSGEAAASSATPEATERPEASMPESAEGAANSAGSEENP